MRHEPQSAIQFYEVALALRPQSAGSHYNAATLYGETNQLHKFWTHMVQARQLWWNEFLKLHSGICLPKLVNCWWDVHGVELQPAKGGIGNPGEEYRQQQSAHLVWNIAGPHNNVWYNDKRPLAASVQQAMVEGTSGIIRVGCSILLGQQGLYIPMHQQNLQAPGAGVKPVLHLPKAITLVTEPKVSTRTDMFKQVSHSSANYFHFLCEVVPRLVLINATWPSLLWRVPVLVRDQMVRPCHPSSCLVEAEFDVCWLCSTSVLKPSLSLQKPLEKSLAWNTFPTGTK